MDSKLIQTLRYRMQNRIRRLKAVDWKFYHPQLVQLWAFLNSHPVFRGILTVLEQEKGEVFETVKPLLDGSSPRDTCIVFQEEKEQAAAAYFIIKDCIVVSADHPQKQKELDVGRRHTQEREYSAAIDAFTATFVMPLYEYLDEQLDTRNILLYLLVRYKHLSEWFRRRTLLDLYEEARKSQ